MDRIAAHLKSTLFAGEKVEVVVLNYYSDFKCLVVSEARGKCFVYRVIESEFKLLDEIDISKHLPLSTVATRLGKIVTNHDSDKDTYPEEQEMIQYGECGIHNDGVIYFIYIMNEESYCYLEMDPTTQEILYEDDPMFNGSEERNERVNKLIEIINTIIDSKSN